MADHARSADSAVQAQLDRLWRLSPGADVLGLDRITRLLSRLGDPHRALPPVFHVAGTNGKGSTCAYLRAALEAAGHRVHAYTSPHLVRFNERIRLAGRLIEDAALAALLEEVLDAGGDVGASFFEVTTAAAFLAFARTPADACVVEVGLGGRLDATNVVAPVVTGIAALGVDHQAFLGDTLEAIAAEKAGIAKGGVPLVTLPHPEHLARIVANIALRADAPMPHWRHDVTSDTLAYADGHGAVTLPLPAMPGTHQADNLALATAMLRHQHALLVPPAALAAAARATRWPARLQRLGEGPLTHGRARPVWLDGGHNPSAAAAITAALPAIAPGDGRDLVLILGMLANKDAAGFVAPLAPRVHTLLAVPVPDHEHHAPADLVTMALALGIPHAAPAENIASALRDAPGGTVLIAGSLYLAGEVLAANDEPPA